MYEARLSLVTADRADEPGAMRALDWSELVARLSATRDLRSVFAAARGDSPASFADGAASVLACDPSGEAGKASVNPDALGAGKRPGPNTVAVTAQAGTCSREMR